MNTSSLLEIMKNFIYKVCLTFHKSTLFITVLSYTCCHLLQNKQNEKSFMFRWVKKHWQSCASICQCPLKSSFLKHEASFPDIQPNHIQFDVRELIQLVFIDFNICLCFLAAVVSFTTIFFIQGWQKVFNHFLTGLGCTVLVAGIFC